eukprot:m.113006 g.113006  ORF g.113006 m.113006 type:complete len:323 (-) comp13498_c0_seq1:502-1470(-)
MHCFWLYTLKKHPSRAYPLLSEFCESVCTSPSPFTLIGCAFWGSASLTAMCFSKEMSGTFALIGLFISGWVKYKTSNTQLAMGVFYFFLMEFLQFFQYLVIDDCDNWWNQFLTVLGFLHICFQPYFTHIINSALTKSPTNLWQYVPILRLCLVGGTMLFLRWVFADYAQMTINDANPSTEWLRGEKLCTFSGKYHLAWSVPMYDPTYWSPGAAIHSFMMFAPFFVLKKDMVIQGVFLWLTGPLLAAYITPNLMEQASIWCFFSISQIGIMLFLIRNVLIVNWRKGSSKTTEYDSDLDYPHIDLRFIWPMGVIEPKKTKGKTN